MAIESNVNTKIYLICLISTGLFMCIAFPSLIEIIIDIKEIHKHFLNRHSRSIAYLFIFHLILMHLLYFRLKAIINNYNLDRAILYGTIYGYISSVFSHLYSEAFFFLEPFSLFGFEKMVRYVALLFARNSQFEFFISTFTTPFLYMGWINGILISIIILLIIRYLNFLNILNL